MPTRQRRRSRFAFLVLPLALTLVAGYFAFQSTRGTYSHDARDALKIERAEQERTLAQLVALRQALEDRVRRLRTDALDADLLDERARAKLNMAFAHELVIFHKRKPNEATALAAHGR
ncbi:MAG: septum formation initiator family protein [Pseudomonadota bacterium]